MKIYLWVLILFLIISILPLIKEKIEEYLLLKFIKNFCQSKRFFEIFLKNSSSGMIPFFILIKNSSFSVKNSSNSGSKIFSEIVFLGSKFSKS